MEWFNGVEGYGLEVEYEGPDIARQTIPDTVLFRSATNALSESSHNGLNVAYHEFSGNVLPDHFAISSTRTGTTTNFSVIALPWREHIAAVFTGSLAVKQAGIYTFHLKSDDGSRLFVGEPTLHLTTLGPATPPPPKRITVGQILPASDDTTWGEVEGKVTLVRSTPSGCQLELTAGAGQMQVEFGVAPDLTTATNWLHARIRATGFCHGVQTDDGQNVAGILLVPGAKEIQLLESPPNPQPPTTIATDTNALPILITAGEVHRLKREEAQRAYQ
ncbi:MAG: PA14 domain-containing protein [Verrucomicrobiota bacterium]